MFLRSCVLVFSCSCVLVFLCSCVAIRNSQDREGEVFEVSISEYLVLENLQESVEDHIFMQDEGSWLLIWVI